MDKSVLIEKEQEVIRPDYSENEEQSIGALQKRLESARDLRDSERDEFDGMDYLTYYDKNEKLANTFIGAKKNKSDTNYQSGTVRQKLLAFLSAVNRMNLKPEISAFDRDNVLHEDLGNAMTTVLRKSEELDNDDEQRMHRQFELLKQGTVFVEDIWVIKKKTEKKLSKQFTGKLDSEWSEKLVEASAQCERKILHGPGVYLGSMSVFNIKDQPFLFTVDVIPYEEAKAVFGEWDRWKYVQKKLRSFKDEEGTLYNNNWRLGTVDEDKVEIIRYQDKWNDELQIIINGVLMLPIGFPLTSISPDGEYTIIKQILELVTPKFPYGKSLPMRLRPQIGVYDELLKLAVLKTQKSFMPPRSNMTGQVIDKNAFMPGVITAGIDPNKLQKLDPDDRGVNNSEIAVLSMISEQLDSNSVDKAFQGGQSEGSNTATEIMQRQEQSNMIVGLTMFSMSLLEKKLADKRLPLLIENWFTPMDKKFDEIKGELKNVYNTANVEEELPNRGIGRSIVIPTDNVGQNDVLPEVGSEEPIRQSIFDEEEKMSEQLGQPVRIIRISPDLIRKRKLIWKTSVIPTEARNSNTSKLMFRAAMADAATYFPDMLNRDHWATRFAQVWDEDPSKAFKMGGNQQVGQPGEAQAEGAPKMAPAKRTEKVNNQV